MKDKKWAYFESTVADFYFSFDLNRDGVFDDTEMSQAF